MGEQDFKKVEFKKKRYISQGGVSRGGDQGGGDNNQDKHDNQDKHERDIKNLQRRIYSPKVDLLERDNSYHIRLELAGMDQSSIKVNLKDEQIVFVSGTKCQEELLETDKLIYKESKFNDFTRRVKLQSLVKYKSQQLKLNNGILNLVFEKKEQKKSEHIPEQKSEHIPEFVPKEGATDWADM